MEVGVQERPRVFPLESAAAPGALLARVGDGPSPPLGVEVDLLMGEADPTLGQGFPELGGPPGRARVLLLDLALLLLGQGWTGRAATGVETGHGSRLTPPLKQFPQPSWGDPPAGGHLSEGLLGSSSLGLSDEVSDPGVGELGHGRSGGTPPLTPLALGGFAPSRSPPAVAPSWYLLLGGN